MMPMNYIENRTDDEIKVGDSAAITCTLKPAEAGLIVPIPVGQAQNIRAIAQEHGFNIGAMRVAHGHDAAAQAVALVRAGRAEARSASCAIALLMADAKRKRP